MILSPAVDAFIEALRQPERGLTRGRLRKLSDPGRFMTMTRPLLGAGPAWRILTLGPFEVTCRLLTEDEARAAHGHHPALEVATIDRTDDLRGEGRRLLDEDEEDEEPEEDDKDEDDDGEAD